MSIRVKPERYLAAVNRGDIKPLGYDLEGIYTQAQEWIAEGWRYDGEPTAPMIAAALFHEANDQDEYVRDGMSNIRFPEALRFLAYRILYLDGQDRELSNVPDYTDKTPTSYASRFSMDELNFEERKYTLDDVTVPQEVV